LKDYTCTEIGMLVGAAIGGGLSLLCFIVSNNSLSFLIAGVGIVIGIAAGSMADKSKRRQD
jgi:uncharacterized membrane protein YgaE (UPF0421/DUF939 family)